MSSSELLKFCGKELSDDRAWAPIVWYGPTTWNGQSLHTNSVTFTSQVSIQSRYYINNESQLETIEILGITYYVLRDGTYLFDGNPFIVTRPFMIILDNAGTCDVEITAVYVDAFGTGEALFNGSLQTVLGFTSLFRLNSSTLVWGGTPGVGPNAFNLEGNLQGVTIMNFVNIVNFSSVGLIFEFNIVSMNFVNISGCTNGVTLHTTQQLIALDRLNLSGGAATYITIIGPFTFPSISINGVNFIPSTPSEYCCYIDPLMFPSCVVSNGTFDNRLLVDKTLQTWFEPSGQDQSSIYVLLGGVKNVRNSKISSVFFYIDNRAQIINAVNQWRLLDLDPLNISGVLNERTQLVSFFITKLTGLEVSDVAIISDCTITNSGSAAAYQLSLCQFHMSKNGTANGTLDVLEVIGHGLVVNDIVWLGRSAALPVELNVYQTYVVHSIVSPDSFRIANAPGAASLVFSNGTVTVVKADLFGSRPLATVGNAVARQIICTGVTPTFTGDDFFVLLRNTQSDRDCELLNFSWSLQK